MQHYGVGVAILSRDRVLLTRREDFEVWCLPSGSGEEGEPLAQTARREAQEETGLEVSIDRLVGIYSMPKGPGGGSFDIIFAGSVTGGELAPDPREVVETGWFGLNDLPEPLLPWMAQGIRDALSGTGGSAVWTTEFAWPFAVSRQEIYRMRDESGLSRQEFFLKHFGGQSFAQVPEVIAQRHARQDPPGTPK